MTLNTNPLGAITQDDIATYERDGVVCLRQVFDADWIDSLKPWVERIAIRRENIGLLPTLWNRNMVRLIPEFRRFIFESPLGEAVGRLLGATEIRFFYDEIFAKAPHSSAKTVWHTDRMGFPVSGKMVPSVWIPLTPIVKANSLECLAQSQNLDHRYWLFSPNGRKMVHPPDRLSHPDVEALRNDPRVRFLTWEMEPGDMLVVHPWCHHYSSGNPTDSWRLAISIRVFGDDIVWDPRPDCLNHPGVSFDEMIPDQKPAGPFFPVIWSRSGRRDPESSFPRGFATTWPSDITSEQLTPRFSNIEYLKNEPGGLTKLDPSSFA